MGKREGVERTNTYQYSVFRPDTYIARTLMQNTLIENAGAVNTATRLDCFPIVVAQQLTYVQ